jgi:diadenosine tetraphosphate (Ap4A) HIT family hydrolase
MSVGMNIVAANERLADACSLCETLGGHLVWQADAWRLVRVLNEPQFPAFYRLIWRSHVAEFSHLSAVEREHCMQIVACVESILIKNLAPTKINLAALGNSVPHLHWHIVARFAWDSHYPEPLWGARQRDVLPVTLERLKCGLIDADAALKAALLAL